MGTGSTSEGARPLGIGAGCADVSARAVERGDDETKAATPSVMIETRGTPRVMGISLF
jgi:hypothetical protein